MAILVSYHKLIERESKNIDWFWKFGTIFFLFVTVACCMVASYSFHKITDAYDDHCILNANVSFIENKSEETTTLAGAFAYSSASSNSFSELNNETDSRPFALLIRKYPYLDENAKSFLNKHIINEQFSNWGPRINCEWALHLPIFQFCFGIILVSFFVICGKGGRADEGSFLVQPWRIVIPALVFFLVMAIISFTHVNLVNSGMDVFCQSLTSEIPSISCYDALNAFKIKSVNTEPDIFYILLYTINWIIFGLWLFLVIVMILRIIFVVDFQLVKVTIKTCEYENANERSIFKVVDSSKDDLDVNVLMDIKYEEFLQDENDLSDNKTEEKEIKIN